MLWVRRMDPTAAQNLITASPRYYLVKLNLNSFIQKRRIFKPNPWVARGRLPIFMEPAQRLERGVQARARREPANIRITITNLC